MAEDAKVYKKFLLQRSILDTLRVYIDPSEDFLGQLETTGLFSNDELVVVRGLRWPSNRNELLQILVKKNWNKKKFQTLCRVLEETQSEQLSHLILDKAHSFIKGREEEEAANVKDPYLEIFEGELVGVGVRARNAVLLNLKEKDDEIRRLKVQNGKLRNANKELSAEMLDYKHKFNLLDKVVTNTVAEMHLNTWGEEEEGDDVEIALTSIKANLDSRQARIDELESETAQQKETIEELRSRISVFTEENISLKQANRALEDKTERQSQGASATIASLRTELHSEMSSVAQLRGQMDGMKTLMNESCGGMESQMVDLERQLQEKTRLLDVAVKEKEKATEELIDIQEKTRKLLFKLDLTNDADKSGLSLDHARNLAYSRRRRVSLTVNQQAPPQQTSQHVAQTNSSMANGYLNTARRDTDSQPDKSSPTATATATATGSSVLPLYSKFNGHSHDAREVSEARPADDNTLTETFAGKLPLHKDHVVAPARPDEMLMKCEVCGKIYVEVSNFVGACIHHVTGATKLYEGTELEVWSCCKSSDTMKGCQKSKHIPCDLYDNTSEDD